MEDVAMIRCLHRRGVTIRTLPATLLTSGRRYRERGVIRTWLHHTLLISLYLAGVPPRRLARLRRAEPFPPPPPPPQARTPGPSPAGARGFRPGPDSRPG